MLADTQSRQTNYTDIPLQRKTWRYHLVRLALILLAIFVTLVISGRIFGLLMIYKIPSNGMKTEIESGDQVFAEGMSLIGSEPKRGDVVTLTTKGLRINQKETTTFVQRIVGIPGKPLS